MDQKCLGCKDECEMSAPHIMTGCTYEDGHYPRNATIWFLKDSLDGEETENHKKNIQEKYTAAWNAEEH